MRSMGSLVGVKKRDAMPLEEGRAFWMGAEFKKCADSMEGILETDNNNVVAVELYASSMYYTGSYDAALEFGESALRIDRESFLANLTMAQVKRSRKQNIQEYLDCALKRLSVLKKGDSDDSTSFSSDPFILTHVAILHLLLPGRSNREKCIEYATAAIELDPEAVMAFNVRGIAYKRTQGKESEMLDDFDNVVSLNPKFASGFFNRGNARQSSGDLHSAMRDYSKAVSLNRGFTAALVKRGMCAAALGDDEIAIADFTRVIRSDPSNMNARILLGQLKAKQDDHEAAIAGFSEALTADPTNTLALSRRARSYLETGEYENAIVDLEAARETCKQWNIFFLLGIAYRETGNYEKALDAFSSTIELRPGKTDGYISKGLVFEAMGRAADALAAYSEAALLKGGGDGNYHRAQMLSSLEKYDDAFHDYGVAIEKDPNFFAAIYHRGLLYSDKGEYELSVADFRRAHELKPSHARCYEALQCVESMLDKSKVRKVLKSRYSIDKSNVDPDADMILKCTSKIMYGEAGYKEYYKRGNAFLRQGKIEPALKDFSESVLLESEMNNWRSYSNKALCQLKLKQYDQSISTCVILLGLNEIPLEARNVAYTRIGNIYLIQEDYQRAVRTLSKAIELGGSLSRPYFYRARAYWELGDVSASGKDLHQLFKIPLPHTDPLLPEIALLHEKIFHERVDGVHSRLSDSTEATRRRSLLDGDEMMRMKSYEKHVVFDNDDIENLKTKFQKRYAHVSSRYLLQLKRRVADEGEEATSPKSTYELAAATPPATETKKVTPPRPRTSPRYSSPPALSPSVETEATPPGGSNPKYKDVSSRLFDWIKDEEEQKKKRQSPRDFVTARKAREKDARIESKICWQRTRRAKARKSRITASVHIDSNVANAPRIDTMSCVDSPRVVTRLGFRRMASVK